MSTSAYYMLRLLDAVLREDLFSVVSTGRLETPAGETGSWLHAPALDWWLPVRPHSRHQGLVATQPCLLHNGRRVEEPLELIGLMEPLVDEPAAMREELLCALEQHELLQSVRLGQEPQGDWSESLLYHDRLASCVDHPLYPTARAKVGLDAEDLRRYAPEWGNEFCLRWVGVPESRLQPFRGVLPTWWPDAGELGLAAGLTPVPVHPHTAGRLELPVGAALAAREAVRVRATLSVRTVALLDHPEFHLKVPLFMRSLSFKNLRKVKPDTLHDGAVMQELLQTIVARHPLLHERVLFSDESVGLMVDGRADLGCIVRRYPADQLQGCRVLPAAALAVADNLTDSFWEQYVELTLRLHLTLWVVYGIALESNQQNTLIVIGADERVRLLLKDNDAARIYTEHAATKLALPDLCDPCLAVSGWEPIAQMFITITLQLNLLPFVDEERLQAALERQLAEFSPHELQRSRVGELLIEPEFHPVKRLWSAGTLFNKTTTGAADINKFYGLTAPNFLSESKPVVPR